MGFCATLVHDVHMMFLMMFNDAYNAFLSAIQSQIAHYLSSFLSKLLKSDLYIEHGDLPAATTRVRFPWKKCSKLFGMAYNF